MYAFSVTPSLSSVSNSGSEIKYSIAFIDFGSSVLNADYSRYFAKTPIP